MIDGKKSIAYNVSMKPCACRRTTGENGLETWKKGIDNIMPSVEVRVEE